MSFREILEGVGFWTINSP